MPLIANLCMLVKSLNDGCDPAEIPVPLRPAQVLRAQPSSVMPSIEVTFVPVAL